MYFRYCRNETFSLLCNVVDSVYNFTVNIEKNHKTDPPLASDKSWKVS